MSIGAGAAALGPPTHPAFISCDSLHVMSAAVKIRAHPRGHVSSAQCGGKELGRASDWVTVTAKTAREPQYALTVTADNHGTASGGGTYDWDRRETFTATPTASFVLSHWPGGVSGSENFEAIVVDTNLTACANLKRVLAPRYQLLADAKETGDDTRLVMPSGLEIEERSAILQDRVRSAIRNEPPFYSRIRAAGEKSALPKDGPWTPSGGQRCGMQLPTQPAVETRTFSLSTTYVWHESGNTAYVQVTRESCAIASFLTSGKMCPSAAGHLLLIGPKGSPAPGDRKPARPCSSITTTRSERSRCATPVLMSIGGSWSLISTPRERSTMKPAR